MSRYITGCAFLTFAMNLTLVTAALYPTNPVSTTVWEPGSNVNISWTDDGEFPQLLNLGPFDIGLFSRDKHVASLADNVFPYMRSRRVLVPENLHTECENRHLRFMWKNRNGHIFGTVYSSNFTITSSNSYAPDNQHILSPVDSSITIPDDHSKPDPLSITQQGSTTTSKDDARYDTIRREGAYVRRPNAGLRNWDMDELKFRLVFMLWPALFGLSMAL